MNFAYPLYCFSPAGLKDPLQCSMAEDFVQKGVVMLQHQTGKCRLKQAKDVARVILAAARGWHSRNTELTSIMETKGFVHPFEYLKPECKSLIEDYVDHMVIVRIQFSCTNQCKVMCPYIRK